MSTEVPDSADSEACEVAPAHDHEDDALIGIFTAARTVAVVGASANPARTSHRIALWLMDNTPYEVYLVNPNAVGKELRGHAFYASLADLPTVPHIVDVFRRSEYVLPVADDAIAAGAAALWLQLGVRNDEAAVKARAAGLAVIQNACIKVEYARVMAGHN